MWFTHWLLQLSWLPFCSEIAGREWWGAEVWEKRAWCPRRDPWLVKHVSPALPMSSRCRTGQVPARSRTEGSEGSSPMPGAEAGREGSCCSASCPISRVPGAAVEGIPSLSSTACPLQLRRCPAAGAAGLHRLSAWLQMPRWWREGQDTDSEEVRRCHEASTEVLGFHTGTGGLRESCRDKLERNAALVDI